MLWQRPVLPEPVVLHRRSGHRHPLTCANGAAWMPARGVIPHISRIRESVHVQTGAIKSRPHSFLRNPQSSSAASLAFGGAPEFVALAGATPRLPDHPVTVDPPMREAGLAPGVKRGAPHG
jgi:hypothetical protein